MKGTVFLKGLSSSLLEKADGSQLQQNLPLGCARHPTIPGLPSHCRIKGGHTYTCPFPLFLHIQDSLTK